MIDYYRQRATAARGWNCTVWRPPGAGFSSGSTLAKSACLTAMSSLTTSKGVNITGSSDPGDRFGNYLTSLGDIDGDGKQDFIVGAPYYSATYTFYEGDQDILTNGLEDGTTATSSGTFSWTDNFADTTSPNGVQYQYQTFNAVQKTISRERVRYGEQLTRCTNSTFWKSGVYDPITGILRRDGERGQDEHPTGARRDLSRPFELHERLPQAGVSEDRRTTEAERAAACVLKMLSDAHAKRDRQRCQRPGVLPETCSGDAPCVAGGPLRLLGGTW